MIAYFFVHLYHFIQNKNSKQLCLELNWQNRTQTHLYRDKQEIQSHKITFKY